MYNKYLHSSDLTLSERDERGIDRKTIEGIEGQENIGTARQTHCSLLRVKARTTSYLK